MQTPRYICTCDPDLAQEQKDNYVYSRQTVLELPQWSKARKQRLKDGNPPTVCIDNCIVEAIKDLWDKGIETNGCCCGHGYMRARVSVDPTDYAAMYELGYELSLPTISDQGYAMGLYTFYL